MSTTATEPKKGELSERELADMMTGETETSTFRKGAESIRLAHQMATQGQIANQARHNEELRQAVNREAIPELEAGDDDVAAQELNIDSPKTTTIHNHYEVAKDETENPAEPERKKRAKKGLGRLAKLAIGAGLVGSGVGGTIGVGMIVDALKGKTAPVVTPSEPDDETRYSLDLGE